MCSLFQINDPMFPIRLDKTNLDFGIDSHKQCPINTVLADILVRVYAFFFFFFFMRFIIIIIIIIIIRYLLVNLSMRGQQVLENTSKEKVEFRLHHTLRNHKMSLLFTPNRGSIKPGKSKEIKVELLIKITTTINEPVVIEALGTAAFISFIISHCYFLLPFISFLLFARLSAYWSSRPD